MTGAPRGAPCPRCERPIEYYASLGEWWCGTATCPSRPAPPKGAPAASESQRDGDRPETRQEELAAAPPSRERPQEPPPTVGDERVAVVVRLADVEAETVRWLWPRRIPLGKLTVWAGAPGVGKSFSLLDLAARVSRGASLPDGEEAPAGDVILLTAEDGLADTVRPRLDLMGADSQRVHALTAVRTSKGEGIFTLEEHVPLLETTIIEKRAILAIVDPVLAYTGRADSYKEAEVRALLAPLAAMAERTGCAVVGVIHLNKRGGEQSPLNRITASLAFVAQARSVLLLAIDPDDETGQRRILAPVKMNLCAHPPSLALHFGEDGGLAWDGPVIKSAAELLALPADKAERSALAESEDFLRELLADGPVEAEEVLKQARRAGVAEKTLRRAKATLGVISERQGGLAAGGRWAWALPKMANGHTTRTLATLDGPDIEEASASVADGHLSSGSLVRLALDLGARLVDETG